VPYCTPFAPACSLELPALETWFEPIQTAPCVQETCWQRVTDAHLCGGETWLDPCVGAQEVPVIDTSAGCAAITCETNTTLVQGVPCHAHPTAHLPPEGSLGAGLDVTDLAGCPMYRAHIP
jgi:hypothetical protein